VLASLLTCISCQQCDANVACACKELEVAISGDNQLNLLPDEDLIVWTQHARIAQMFILNS